MAKKNSNNAGATASASTQSAPVPSVALTTADVRPATLAIMEAFQSENFQLPEGVEIKALSPMIKPIDFPVGRILVGKLTRIFETKPGQNEDGSAKKGEGLEIIPHGAKVGVSLPATAVLRTALDITGKGGEAKPPYLGRYLAIQKTANKIPSKKGNDAWNFMVAIYPEGHKFA